MEKTREGDAERQGCCERVKNSRQIDGGWAWMVFISNALNYIIIVPMMQNFALIYRERFVELNMSSTSITSIISANSATGMFLGIFNAPLLKKYGFRTMAYVSIIIYTLGYLLTCFALNTFHFAITYGFITSIGSAFDMASFNLAFNSYFRDRRARATGHLMGVTGFGPIFMPLFISFLLEEIGMKPTVFVLVSLCAGILLPTTAFLRPISEKENQRFLDEKAKKVLEIKKEADEALVKPEDLDKLRSPLQRSISRETKMMLASQETLGDDNDEELEPSYGECKVFKRQQSQSNNSNGPVARTGGRKTSVSSNFIFAATETTNLSFSLDDDEYLEDEFFEEAEKSVDSAKLKTVNLANIGLGEYKDIGKEQREKDVFMGHKDEADEGDKNPKTLVGKFTSWLKKTYDLDLFADPSFTVLIIGVSIAVVAEITFSLLTPMILKDIDLDVKGVGVFYSILSTGDIILRFIAPYFGEMLNFNTKGGYLISLFFLCIMRAVLFFVKDYYGVMVIGLLLGMAKGFRTVYWVLVIPNSVPLEKLASATAIQNMLNGMMMLISGPIIGLLIEWQKSYLTLVWIADSLTATTMVLWIFEHLGRGKNIKHLFFNKKK